MKTLKNWQLKKLDRNDSRCNGYYNLPYILRYRNHEVIAPNGNTDNVQLYQEGDDIILLCSNSKYGYAGITVYNKSLEEKSELFIQNANEELDYNFFDYTYIHQAKILYSLIG